MENNWGLHEYQMGDGDFIISLFSCKSSIFSIVLGLQLCCDNLLRQLKWEIVKCNFENILPILVSGKTNTQVAQWSS